MPMQKNSRLLETCLGNLLELFSLSTRTLEVDHSTTKIILLLKKLAFQRIDFRVKLYKFLVEVLCFDVALFHLLAERRDCLQEHIAFIGISAEFKWHGKHAQVKRQMTNLPYL